MFHIAKMKFCRKNNCFIGIKHIFGAKDTKDAFMKFASAIRDLDIEPIEVRIYAVSDLMEENGMYEAENWSEVME